MEIEELMKYRRYIFAEHMPDSNYLSYHPKLNTDLIHEVLLETSRKSNNIYVITGTRNILFRYLSGTKDKTPENLYIASRQCFRIALDLYGTKSSTLNDIDIFLVLGVNILSPVLPDFLGMYDQDIHHPLIKQYYLQAEYVPDPMAALGLAGLIQGVITDKMREWSLCDDDTIKYYISKMSKLVHTETSFASDTYTNPDYIIPRDGSSIPISKTYVVKSETLQEGMFGDVAPIDEPGVVAKTFIDRYSTVSWREIIVLAALQDIEGVIKVRRISARRGLVSMIMEQGEDLETTDMTLESFKDVCRSMKTILNRGIIHGDIKPENFVKVDDKIKFIDFGHYQYITYPEKSRYNKIYTTWYRPPEIFETKDFDHRADIWALGMMLWSMTASKWPFLSEDETDHLELIRDLQAKDYEISKVPEWSRILIKTLLKHRTLPI